MFSKMLIGNKVKIVSSTVPTLIQRSGEIVDETKNTLKIACVDNSSKSKNNDKKKIITVPKATSVFELQISNSGGEEGKKSFTISGKEILGTMQERIHRV